MKYVSQEGAHTVMVELVVFDFGGVVGTSPSFVIQKYGWEKGIPRLVKV